MRLRDMPTKWIATRTNNQYYPNFGTALCENLDLGRVDRDCMDMMENEPCVDVKAAASETYPRHESDTVSKS